MDKDVYLESNASQKPAIELLESMGYTYLSPSNCEMQRGGRYHVLLKDILRGQLRRLNRYSYASVENEFSAANIERAMEDLDEPLADGLVRASEKIYDALLLGRSYQEAVGEGKLLSFNLKYIDWENWGNNVFHVTEEFAVESQDKRHNARPDIVLFVNGIPFAVIECKAPQIPVELAVEQMIRNQQSEYIPQLFKYAQIVLAINRNAAKYATAGTPKKFWSVWKEAAGSRFSTYSHGTGQGAGGAVQPGAGFRADPLFHSLRRQREEDMPLSAIFCGQGDNGDDCAFGQEREPAH